MNNLQGQAILNWGLIFNQTFLTTAVISFTEAPLIAASLSTNEQYWYQRGAHYRPWICPWLSHATELSGTKFWIRITIHFITYSEAGLVMNGSHHFHFSCHHPLSPFPLIVHILLNYTWNDFSISLTIINQSKRLEQKHFCSFFKEI